MIVCQRNSLRFGYVLHDNEYQAEEVDIVHIVHRSKPAQHALIAPASTVMLRLNLPEHSLLKGLPETTAYEIRRSERDHISCQFIEKVKPAELKAFLEFCDAFVRLTSNPSPDCSWLETLRVAGTLRISVARNASREQIVYHAYWVDGKSCRLLHSVSLHRQATDNKERNLISRANRLLHWRDLLHFKSLGMELYDFGGWYPRLDNKHMLGINRFKESFGGQVVFGAHCDIAITPKGRIWLLAGWLARLTRNLVLRARNWIGNWCKFTARTQLEG